MVFDGNNKHRIVQKLISKTLLFETPPVEISIKCTETGKNQSQPVFKSTIPLLDGGAKAIIILSKNFRKASHQLQLWYQSIS